MLKILHTRNRIFLIILFIIFICFFILLLNYSADGFQQTNIKDKTEAKLERVRKNLEDIPEYGVFDWIESGLNPNGKILLRGWVIFPETKTETLKVVEKVFEKNEIEDQIQVLPKSRIDDKIRNTAWKEIERIPELEKFVEGANPFVHIIVNQQKISLYGRVYKKNEAELFGVILQGMPNVLSVQDNLQILPPEK